MMRISEQYIWHVLFALFFLSLVLIGTAIIEPTNLAFKNLSVMELVILSLATLRLTRLVVYDTVTDFFREQFYDLVEMRGRQYLEKPASGPRRTLAELLACPWCVGLWMGASLVFFYYLTPYSWFVILFLAIAGLGSVLQILANLLGWRAEQLKNNAEG